MASAMRVAALAISVSVSGSGISRRTVGSRNSWTASTSTSRPARMRASSSDTPWRCAIIVARASPRASSRARQMRPVTEHSTPRNAEGIPLKAGNGRAMLSVWSESHRDIDLKYLRPVEKMTCAQMGPKQLFSFSPQRIAACITRKYVWCAVTVEHHARESQSPRSFTPRLCHSRE